MDSEDWGSFEDAPTWSTPGPPAQTTASRSAPAHGLAALLSQVWGDEHAASKGSTVAAPALAFEPVTDVRQQNEAKSNLLSGDLMRMRRFWRQYDTVFRTNSSVSDDRLADASPILQRLIQTGLSLNRRLPENAIISTTPLAFDMDVSTDRLIPLEVGSRFTTPWKMLDSDLAL